jgi:hypothetical protein
VTTVTSLPPLEDPVRRTPASLLALTLLTTGAPAAFLSAPAAAVEPGNPAVTGRFAAPFEEAGERCVVEEDGEQQCKPAAGSIATLPNGKVIYWDALDSIQEAEYSATFEFGDNARNGMARVLDLRGPEPVFTTSDPDAAVDPEGNDGSEFLPGPLHNNDEKRNDADLFCSDQVFLADGRILDVGGTSYYQEPGVPGQPTYGAVELEGLKNSRIYDTESNTWKATGQMTYGRWYPSVVTLPDGKVAAFSGVTKLIKPVYADRPADSGRNVTQSEVYDPETGEWTVDGGNKSLPLYPRLHLLPNGHVYYDAAGQTFNPSGQAYDEALWNMASSYDPETRSWRDLGLPEFGNGLKGFRGSAFSQMLPLTPNDQGEYDTVEVLSAGGVYGVTPGTYVGTDTSTLNRISIAADGSESFSSRTTGSLNNPRWYSTGVSLPTGEVIAFSGADRDEVVAPGSGTAVTTPEMYDPRTGEWTELASQSKGRTYHNSATLLTDGRILVGGHAPITTGYGASNDAFEQNLGFSNPDRDPSFEIFSPPNLFYGARPVITKVDPSVGRGRTLEIATPDAKDISSVTLVRNTAMTHLVDSDQRTVVLPIVSRTAGRVVVEVTDNAAVLPDGPYTLFANKAYEQGETPSVGRQVFVGAVPAELADDVAHNNAATLGQELAARAGAARTGTSRSTTATTAGSGTGQGSAAGSPAAAPTVAQEAAAAPVELGGTELAAAASPLARGQLPVALLALSSLVGAALVLRRRTSTS